MSAQLIEPSATGDAELELDLESALPSTMPVGRGTALLLFGSCFHRREELRSLEILVDGIGHPVTAFAMPRIDRFRSLHPRLSAAQEVALEEDPASAEDPEIRAYRSGFWAVVPIEPRAQPGRIELWAQAGLTGGGTARATLAEIEVAEPAAEPAPAAAPGAGPGLIAICMATFDPNPELFRAQVESIRAQSDGNWICLISDDCSLPDRFAAIEATVADDRRFVVSRSQRRLGFYRNFERALRIAPAEAELIALCDQDDRWNPDKLEVLRGAIGDANLVYSDQRLVDPSGAVLAGTYWTERRNNHTDLASLLIANTVTGAASLIRRDVVDLALPFPEAPGEQYHDHWLALVALATGRLVYVDRPLYDYVQHGAAALGHADANVAVPRSPGGGPWGRLRRARREFKDWPAAYFNGYLRLVVLARALLVRGQGRLSRRKRRALGRLIAAERSPLAFAWLAARAARRRFGRDETLGIEKVLARGVIWRHLIGLRTRGRRTPEGYPYDASLPPAPLRGGGAARAVATAGTGGELALMRSKIEPLELTVSERAPQRVNLLIPTIDLDHLFAGYIAKLNLARKLAEAGHATRIVAVDPTPPLPADWRRQVESYSGLAGALSQVEVAFARDRDRPLEISPGDRFIATTWWTAQIAHRAVAATSSSRFLYLIQEYEPITFPMGSWAALASSSYELPHQALFSTELLRSFFAERRLGVFAAGQAEGERRSTSFQNAITAVRPPPAAELEKRSSRRLLFYARPEPHAARNMFELGILALGEALEQGVFGPEWEFTGIGAVGGGGSVPLAGSASLELLARRSQADYARLLASGDLGLSLMLTPHPSLPPIEMAAAGMPTVTNSFETKTAAAMGAISSNLIVVEPSIDGVVAGLRSAAAAVGDTEARIAGAAVDWPSDWDDSLGAEVIGRIASLLDDC